LLESETVKQSSRYDESKCRAISKLCPSAYCKEVPLKQKFKKKNKCAAETTGGRLFCHPSSMAGLNDLRGLFQFMIL